MSRPLALEGVAGDAVSERQQRSAALAQTLKREIPVDPDLRTREQAAPWLLTNLLDWHRREAKAEWWEFFRMKDLTDEDLLDERSAIARLKNMERLSVVRNIPTDRYSFDKQETDTGLVSGCHGHPRRTLPSPSGTRGRRPSPGASPSPSVETEIEASGLHPWEPGPALMRPLTRVCP